MRAALVTNPRAGRGQFDLNYTYGKSIDLSSSAERVQPWNGGAGGISGNISGKLDLGSESDGLLLAGRARDRAVAHVERECVLAEVLAVLREPRTADDLAATRKDFVDDRRVDVGTVDVESVDDETLGGDICDQFRSGLLLGAICRKNGTERFSSEPWEPRPTS